MTDFTALDFMISLALAAVAVWGVMHTRSQLAKGGF